MDIVESIVSAAHDTSLLIDFLAAHLSLSKKKAKQILDARAVFVNDRRVWMAKHRLKAGDRVEVHTAVTQQRAEHVRVLYEDEQYIVADKPPGIITTGECGLESLLRQQLKLRALAAVHRLDRDTSGCLLFAKNGEAHAGAIELFRERLVRKVYRAIVLGRIPQSGKRLTMPIDGQQAVTKLAVLGTGPDASYVEAVLVTGRTHQIRKHVAALRHPVLGDKEYATGRMTSPISRAASRQMLHAFIIGFTSPTSGKKIRCRAPLPPDFLACLQALGLHERQKVRQRS